MLMFSEMSQQEVMDRRTDRQTVMMLRACLQTQELPDSRPQQLCCSTLSWENWLFASFRVDGAHSYLANGQW